MNLKNDLNLSFISKVMSDNVLFASSMLPLIETPTTGDIVGNGLDLGPIREPLSTVIPMTIVYALILITGVIGNIITCLVISRNRYMHTATNYYLFSLAVSDLLLLVLGLPQEIYQLWHRYPYALGEVFCVLRGFTSEASTNSSVLTITAFTIERYVAICHPLKAHTMSKLSRAVKLIIIIWFLGLICAVPIAYQFGIVYDYNSDGVIQESAACSIKRVIPYLNEHTFTISSLLVFVIPVTIISVLYMLIGLKLRFSAAVRNKQMTSNSKNECELTVRNGSTHSRYQSSKRPIEHKSSSNSTNSLAQRRAVIKMLIAVVVAFFVCFAPFHAQRLMAIYVKNPTQSEIIFHSILSYISGVTYYLSATINPILYSIMSVKFRQAFKDTFMKCFVKQRTSNRLGKFVGSTSSYSHIRFNSKLKSNLSRTEMSQCLSDNKANDSNNNSSININKKQANGDIISDFIPLSRYSQQYKNV
ncbi:pyrokinin-1 receptor-like [Oppia nitens]|uniref:pyrokinin-1 receptor-like n=1 Tax=Oppia nitens TaxID=1686743 RepID=UPI0023DC2A2F|nr:pyrokinin-1 receptor-like [Oppia nitens]